MGKVPPSSLDASLSVSLVELPLVAELSSLPLVESPLVAESSSLCASADADSLAFEPSLSFADAVGEVEALLALALASEGESDALLLWLELSSDAASSDPSLAGPAEQLARASMMAKMDMHG